MNFYIYHKFGISWKKIKINFFLKPFQSFFLLFWESTIVVTKKLTHALSKRKLDGQRYTPSIWSSIDLLRCRIHRHSPSNYNGSNKTFKFQPKRKNTPKWRIYITMTKDRGKAASWSENNLEYTLTIPQTSLLRPPERGCHSSVDLYGSLQSPACCSSSLCLFLLITKALQVQ